MIGLILTLLAGALLLPIFYAAAWFLLAAWALWAGGVQM